MAFMGSGTFPHVTQDSVLPLQKRHSGAIKIGFKSCNLHLQGYELGKFPEPLKLNFLHL